MIDLEQLERCARVALGKLGWWSTSGLPPNTWCETG
jgi:hypothetical protein